MEGKAEKTGVRGGLEKAGDSELGEPHFGNRESCLRRFRGCCLRLGKKKLVGRRLECSKEG